MWGFTGSDVFGSIREVLEDAHVLAEALEALLVLIPKEESPTNIRRFRPISLCDVVIKLAMKMVVNRLEEI